MNYAIKDACNVTLYHRGTGKPVMFSDYLNGFNLSLSAETVYATAKGSNKIAFDGALEGTVTLDAEVIEFKYLAMLLGSEVITGETEVANRVLAKTDAQKKIKLGATAIPGSIAVFSVEKDKKTHIEELTFTASDVSGSTEITLTSVGVTAGDEVAVYYLVRKPNVKKISVRSDSKGANYFIEGYTEMKNEFGESEIFTIKIRNCKPQRNVELSLSADAVASFSATFDVLADETGELVELALLGTEGATRMANYLDVPVVEGK